VVGCGVAGCGTIEIVKQAFTARIWREGKWFVSQCLEIDIASQGDTEEEALANLKEALELHFEPPQATRPPKMRTVEVEVGAA
jgi:predicted RNase H-like HicB family nuclease